ncbi:MAG: ASCH domain-containing protein [Paracoccaceae bacterium]
MTGGAGPVRPGLTLPADAAALVSDWRAATGSDAQVVDVMEFGDAPAMMDELLGLVLAGPKRATAGLLRDYDGEGWMPRPGDASVVRDGAGRARAVIVTTQVRVGPLSSVDADFAWDEGEGERTRDWWLAAHESYFRRQAEAEGFDFAPDIETVFERFDLVWPAPPQSP